MMNSYQVNLAPVDDLSSLAKNWQELEHRSNSSFFLSWPWIHSWINCFGHRASLLSITFKGKLIALCFITKQLIIRHKLIYSNALHINQTGKPDEDQIWSEFNGLLVDQDHEESATQAFFDFLIENSKPWDELITGVISDSRQKLYQTSSRLHCHVQWQQPGYEIDLDCIRNSNDNFLASLSRNTRYRINKSRKHYESLGEVSINKASSVDQALAFLEEIAPIHVDRWQHTAEGSGFNNPKFKQFHQHLIKSNWKNNCVELIKIVCADRVLAYFYNFIYNNKVYFYLSAIPYSQEEKKLQPGLLCHALCIQNYMDNNLQSYDFLGGEAQYKQSLSNKQYQLAVLSLQKATPMMLLERAARFAKNLLNIKG